MHPYNLYTIPVSLQVNFDLGNFEPCSELIVRNLSDLSSIFNDQQALQDLLVVENPVVYEFRYAPFVTPVSDMTFGITRINPGKVGNEYYMTKGHFHEHPDQPEIYTCVRGCGYLLLENHAGEFKAEQWQPGTVTHIPPGWAHRAVNTGDGPLIFLAFYHLSAGHDYGTIEKTGFASLLIEQEDKPVFISNPARKSG
jgi:glucose-6-phosphate isomerase